MNKFGIEIIFDNYRNILHGRYGGGPEITIFVVGEGPTKDVRFIEGKPDLCPMHLTVKTQSAILALSSFQILMSTEATGVQLYNYITRILTRAGVLVRSLLITPLVYQHGGN